MKALIFFIISILCMHANGETNLDVSFSKLPSGNYQCTIKNKGDSVIFGDPAYSEVYLFINIHSEKGALFQFLKNRDSRLNKRLILLTRFDQEWPGHPDAYTYKFEVLASELKEVLGPQYAKSNVVGIRLWAASLNEFKKEEAKAFKFVELKTEGKK